MYDYKLIILDPNREYRSVRECFDYYKAQYYSKEEKAWWVDPNTCIPPLVGKNSFVKDFYEQINFCLTKVSNRSKVLVVFGNSEDFCDLDIEKLFAKIPCADAVATSMGEWDEEDEKEYSEGYFVFKGRTLEDYRQKVKTFEDNLKARCSLFEKNHEDLQRHKNILYELENGIREAFSLTDQETKKVRAIKDEIQSGKEFRLFTSEDKWGRDIEDEYAGKYIFPNMGLLQKSLDIFNVSKSEALIISDRSEVMEFGKRDGIKVIKFKAWFSVTNKMENFKNSMTLYNVLPSARKNLSDIAVKKNI